MEKPDVDYIEGLSPAISIDQKTTSRNPRSTVGTVTEIHDYLQAHVRARRHAALSEMRAAKFSSRRSTRSSISVLSLPERTKILVLAPIIRGRKGENTKLLEDLQKQGFRPRAHRRRNL